MVAPLEVIGGNLLGIDDFCNGTDGKASQVAVEQHRLGIGVRDDSYAAVADELVKFILKLGPEIRTLEAVNTPHKALVFAESRKASPLGAEV